MSPVVGMMRGFFCSDGQFGCRKWLYRMCLRQKWFAARELVRPMHFDVTFSGSAQRRVCRVKRPAGASHQKEDHMIQKLIFGLAICLGSLALTQNTAQADDCYRSRRGYAPVYGYSYRPPVTVGRSYGVYRPPVAVPRYPAYRYSPGFGYPGFYRSPGIGIGYSNFGYGGYRRGGVTIGFGF